MPRTERSRPSPSSDDGRPSLPEGTEHVVVIGSGDNAWGSNPDEYRVPAVRLARYDDVDLSEYVDEDEDPENVTVFFEPGDELPLPVARDGTYRSFSEMFACFDADGNRLDASEANVDEGVRQWQATRGRS